MNRTARSSFFGQRHPLVAAKNHQSGCESVGAHGQLVDHRNRCQPVRDRPPRPRVENVRDALTVHFTVLAVVPGRGDRDIRNAHDPLDGLAERLQAVDGDLPGLAGFVPAAGPQFAADIHEKVCEPSIGQLTQSRSVA